MKIRINTPKKKQRQTVQFKDMLPGKVYVLASEADCPEEAIHWMYSPVAGRALRFYNMTLTQMDNDNKSKMVEVDVEIVYNGPIE